MNSENSMLALQSLSTNVEDLVADFERIRLLLLNSKKLSVFLEQFTIKDVVLAYKYYMALSSYQFFTYGAGRISILSANN